MAACSDDADGQRTSAAGTIAFIERHEVMACAPSGGAEETSRWLMTVTVLIGAGVLLSVTTYLQGSGRSLSATQTCTSASGRPKAG